MASDSASDSSVEAARKRIYNFYITNHGGHGYGGQATGGNVNMAASPPPPNVSSPGPSQPGSPPARYPDNENVAETMIRWAANALLKNDPEEMGKPVVKCIVNLIAAAKIIIGNDKPTAGKSNAEIIAKLHDFTGFKDGLINKADTDLTEGLYIFTPTQLLEYIQSEKAKEEKIEGQAKAYDRMPEYANGEYNSLKEWNEKEKEAFPAAPGPWIAAYYAHMRRAAWRFDRIYRRIYGTPRPDVAPEGEVLEGMLPPAVRRRVLDTMLRIDDPDLDWDSELQTHYPEHEAQLQKSCAVIIAKKKAKFALVVATGTKGEIDHYVNATAANQAQVVITDIINWRAAEKGKNKYTVIATAAVITPTEVKLVTHVNPSGPIMVTSCSIGSP